LFHHLLRLTHLVEKRLMIRPVLGPEIAPNDLSKVHLDRPSPLLVGLEHRRALLEVRDTSGLRGKPRRSEHPRTPVLIALALIALATSGYEIVNLMNVAGRTLPFDQRAQ